MSIFDTLKKKLKIFHDKNIIGLDIGDESIKLTEVHTKWGSIVLNNVAIIPTPLGTVNDGELTNVMKLEKVIKQVLEEKEFQSKKVVTAISGEKVITRMIDIPEMSEEELSKSIKWEAADKMPIQIDEAILDYEILDRKENGGYKILLIAVKKDLINKYLNLIETLELEPVAIEIEPIAIARTIDRLYTSKVIGIIDIGTKTTDISILHSGQLVFTRTVNIGGDNITKDLSETNGYSLEEAEEYKRVNNLFDKQEANLIIRNLTTSIYRSLDYFQVKYKDFDIGKIVLTGGGGNLIGFDSHLTREFGVSVEKLNLSDRLKSDIVSSDYLLEVAQLLGVSIGLALREEDHK
jgi:type IV pilus assembly protein PilM